MFLNSMARLLRSRTIALIITQEDVFQARFVAGQADDSIVRGGLDHCIRFTLHSQTQRISTRQRLHLCYTIQGLERLGRHRIGERDRDFVALDVLEFGHATHAHQLPLTNDPYAGTGLFDLAQDVRGQKDGTSLIAHFFDHPIELLLVERVQAIGRLIQNKHTRAVHKGLNQHHLALIATRIVAKLAAGVQVQSLDKLLKIGLIDASAQMSEVFQNLPAGKIGIQRWFSGQIANQPLNLYRLLPTVQPGDARAACISAQQRHEQANGGGFASAVRAKEAKHLALFHVEGDVGNTAFASVALSQALYFDDRCHVAVLLLFFLLRYFFGFLNFIQILGPELFAHIALAGKLLRFKPATYQVAEHLRQLLHGWHMLLAEDIRRVDHANLQSGQQIGNDGSRNICTDQPGTLKLVKIGIGITYELIEKACIRGSEKPVEDVRLAPDNGGHERIGQGGEQAVGGYTMQQPTLWIGSYTPLELFAIALSFAPDGCAKQVVFVLPV